MKKNEVQKITELAQVIEVTEMSYDDCSDPKDCCEYNIELQELYKKLDRCYRKLVKDLWCKSHNLPEKYQSC